MGFFNVSLNIIALNASGNEFLPVLSILRPDTCPLLQDERVNTVQQEPQLQPVLYIRDVTDGMIEYCGRYNVIVGSRCLASHPDTDAPLLDERVRCSARKPEFVS